MLTSATWSNFKLYGPQTTFPFAPITVLTGANGRGKSTALQPLLCLAQSRLHSFTEPVRLSGEFVQLGTFGDVRNRDVPEREPILWTLEFTDSEADVWVVTMTLTEDAREPGFVRVVSIEVEEPLRDSVAPRRFTPVSERPMLEELWKVLSDDINPSPSARALLRWPALQLRNLRFVSADRLGPQSFVPREVLDDRFSVGPRGERTVEVLGRAIDAQMPLSEARFAPSASLVPGTVFDQAGAWMNWIFDGAGIKVESTDLVRTLRMNADSGTRYARPSNTGYGFTCLLPLIVEGLIAEKGSVFVMENPEAHLHPWAVSRFACFVAMLANDGVQLCVETHSEHFLNGLRLEIANKHLRHNDVSVLFFRKHEVAPVLRVEILPDGRIEQWPDGFFDTAAIALAKLHGF